MIIRSLVEKAMLAITNSASDAAAEALSPGAQSVTGLPPQLSMQATHVFASTTLQEHLDPMPSAFLGAILPQTRNCVAIWQPASFL